MSNASSIAASGLAAAAQRLEVSASNIANAAALGPSLGPGTTTSSSGDAPKRVVQTARAGGGTHATVTALPVAFTPAFDAPSGAAANIPGASTNVDLANEIIQQIMARYGFAANAQAMKADARLVAAFLDMTA